MPAVQTLNKARELLQKHFGYPDFRGGEADAISAVLNGRDTLVLMPTGGGKSLCYQVPALMLPGLTLVVSPIISLMKDKVDALDAAGLPATYINSSVSARESESRIARALRGELKLLYVAPKRFNSPAFRARLTALNISLFAGD